MTEPLGRLRSLKAKFSIVIVAAVVVTLVVNEVGLWLNVKTIPRAAVAAAIALGMVQLLARGMTRPLREMEQVATALAAGDLSRRAHTTSVDEVGRLAVAFNEMADELSELDRQRRDLVANVSHELRTPISALRATLENILDGVTEPAPELVATMLSQTERLGRLVSSLLDLSRLEAGLSPLHRTTFAAADLLDGVADEARMHDPGLGLEVLVDPPDLTIDGDPERLHQVVANLVENAAGFTPDDVPVVVEARRRPGGVLLAVTDQGPGIDEDDRQRVFERFYRADPARSGDGGAGLGLAVAKWVVDLHGGAIQVDEGHRPGCRVVVELPGPRGAPALTNEETT